ncbi:MAG: DUF2281 domain-containing protein [Cyanobacteria bacterium P01_D01_bin.71]
MNIEQALLDQVRTLTPEQQQAVLEFAVSLHPETPPAPKKRIPGLHRGAFYWMADDFDDPLPDEFWLGEDA